MNLESGTSLRRPVRVLVPPGSLPSPGVCAGKTEEEIRCLPST
jgi:hypothetical protein